MSVGHIHDPRGENEIRFPLLKLQEKLAKQRSVIDEEDAAWSVCRERLRGVRGQARAGGAADAAFARGTVFAADCSGDFLDVMTANRSTMTGVKVLESDLIGRQVLSMEGYLRRHIRTADRKDLAARLLAAPLEVSRCQAERRQRKRVRGLSPGRQGHDLALTVLCVPISLERGFIPIRKC